MASNENEYLLTTIDNPFNPFTEPEKWNEFDSENGYHTTNFLARVLKSPNGLTEEDEKKDMNEAIQDIIDSDPFGIYIRVKESDRIIPVPVKSNTRGES